MKITWLQNFDNDHKDSIWYGGYIVNIELEDYAITIGAFGDIRGAINGEYYKDKNNGGMFAEYLNEQKIFNDKDLEKAYEEGRIQLDDNNWFEAVVWDKKKRKYVGNCCDMVIDELDRNDDFKWVKEWLKDIV